MAQTKPLSGAERAAVFLLALGAEHGHHVWTMLDDDEIRIVSTAMAQLGNIESQTVEELLVDFSRRIGGAAVRGDYERTEELLLRMLPKERAEFIMEEIRGPVGRDIWQKLANVRNETLAAYLKNEHPQTAALILSRLPKAKTASILASLPEGLAVEMVNRMLSMADVPREVLQGLEHTLRADFVSSLAMRVRHDSYEKMASIFNEFDSVSEARVLAALHKVNAPAAERIRALMFVFDDLARLGRNELQLVLTGVTTDVLARALKGASETVREAIFACMSQRARLRTLDEIGSLGPQRLRDVDKAQQAILAYAEALAAEGKIRIAKSNSEEDAVVE